MSRKGSVNFVPSSAIYFEVNDVEEAYGRLAAEIIASIDRKVG